MKRFRVKKKMERRARFSLGWAPGLRGSGVLRQATEAERKLGASVALARRLRSRLEPLP